MGRNIKTDACKTFKPGLVQSLLKYNRLEVDEDCSDFYSLGAIARKYIRHFKFQSKSLGPLTASDLLT